MNTDAFKVFDSFNEFVKHISNETNLVQNLPFGFSVKDNTTVTLGKYLRSTKVNAVHNPGFLWFQG